MGYSVKLAGSAAAIVVVSSFLQPLQEHSLISQSSLCYWAARQILVVEVNI